MWCAPLPISGHIRAARVLIARATNPACGFSQIGREANATRATTSRDQTTDRRSDSLPQDRQTINRSLDGPFPLTDPRCCWPFPRPTALTIVPVTRPACHRLGGRWPPQVGHHPVKLDTTPLRASIMPAECMRGRGPLREAGTLTTQQIPLHTRAPPIKSLQCDRSCAIVDRLPLLRSI